MNVTYHVKRLSLTHNGMIDVAYSNTQVDDEIFVLSNAPMPFMLTSLEGPYAIDGNELTFSVYKMQVGSYVHGSMDGEAIYRRNEGIDDTMKHNRSKIMFLEL
jgi:hypothetical protein